ncbi:NDxxF motif lipoprotein [Shouchella sp. JSM 1781072]|uniref:NDxxF motif lipoprotein n=1 Tax=Shouchella sp. JSM 1781072 TaxID=3344581 RepID=UPI0035C1353C
MKTFSLTLCLCITVLFTACSPEEQARIVEEEVEKAESLDTISIPTHIFKSDVTHQTLSTDKLHASIQDYLNASADLDHVMSQFEQTLDAQDPLTTEETAKAVEVMTLLKENDENFSTYIESNTLPEGYDENVERIQQYITGYHEFLTSFHDSVNQFDQAMDDLLVGSINLDALLFIDAVPSHVNGREQQKIETFLEDKGIETHLFD